MTAAAFSAAIPGLSASIYVDSAASGGDGRSWSGAYRRFSDINWSSVQPGDVIYISGGSSSKVYNETLYVGASGTSAAPVVITRGKDPGHNGRVIIDGRGSLSHGVFLQGKSYVHIRGLEIDRCHGGGAVKVRYARGVVVDGMTIEVHGHGGVFVEESDNCVVRSCFITTPSYTSSQTDGIYAQRNSGNIYENNRIIISNNDPDPHCDGIQTFQETSPVIRGNYIEQDNNKTGNAQGIYSTTGYGLYRIYNNVVVAPNTKAQLIGHRNLTTSSNAEVYNNTVIGRSGNMIRVSGNNPAIMNNVVIKLHDSFAIVLEDRVFDYSRIDNNLIFIPGNRDPIYYYPETTSLSWNEWRSRGAEAHGIYQQDPLLDGNQVPRASSPCIDAGVDLGSLFNVDMKGNPRQPGSWDIGAIEAGGSGGSGPGSGTRPAPPGNLQLKVE
jgi:hypothetical protein